MVRHSCYRGVRLAFLIASVLLAALPIRSNAAVNFSGTWHISGTLRTSVSVGSLAPVCVLKQSGDTILGPCRGPNGQGNATGIVNANRIQLTWNEIRTTAFGLTGVITFHGALGSDGVIRGTWTSSAVPGVGTFTAIR
jgi:hypothetical protein